ncbi:MAG: molybdate ABC transporter substrate-binding protein [Magnetococcales bacterium]|nr:molybdate ABC transporter substrate-binding protein [Magnetococcales bacterium]
MGLLWRPHPAWGESLRVAVASNFNHAMTALVEAFEKQSDHQVIPVYGSTGKHFAQIHHGAPFELFLAADIKRPRLLEKSGEGISQSRFTYAIGRLALWSPEAHTVTSGGGVLETGHFRYLALANPKLAPYGLAAREVLEQRGIWSSLRGRLVRGENIGQAFQFVKSGNAQLGFVALAQIQHPGQPLSGSHWLVPASLHTPLEQQGILLKESPGGRALIDFIQGEKGRAIIQAHGYGVP